LQSKVGVFEELVLLAVCGLSGRAYAVTVQQAIETVGEREAALGAVYSSLERLERKGYLRSLLGPVTNQQGGKKKRYYQITGDGQLALARAQQTRDKLWTQIDARLRPSPAGTT